MEEPSVQILLYRGVTVFQVNYNLWIFEGLIWLEEILKSIWTNYKWNVLEEILKIFLFLVVVHILYDLSQNNKHLKYPEYR